MKKLLLSFVLIVSLITTGAAQNPWYGKVFLQAFWWDYYNSNYPEGWYNYLSELAPRLREIGLDAVWIPPSTKAGGSGSVGYDPFDGYDLGDKYQKGLKTRLGDKNEYLRMVAVMHANGIEVIQDVIVNHASNAEVPDPQAWDNQSKNFRYVCYETNANTEYSARKGRWSKNWMNFHPNTAHNCNAGDICSDWWGPDYCYWSGAYGKSSNATYNPDQYEYYMRINARNWLIWLKKQTGVDGFRFDAVKHFETDVAEDFFWNLQNNAGWASGGEQTFIIGEFLDNAGNMDNWCNAVSNRAGTFDFSIRYAVKDMATSNGYYDLGSILGTQQSNRTRTAPFVNNHDTFRPIKDSIGNYIGWDTGHETGGHLEPYEPRIGAAYAIALSVDGNPSIFFEDLFNLGNTGKRFSHRPTSTTDLPQFEDIATLIHLYKRLNFKGGAYKVPFKSPDHLIIERSGKALIGVNDSWDAWKGDWISTDFPAGTVLIDYTGSSGATDRRTVTSDQRIQISTPPCNGTAKRRGYSVWAPEGIPDFKIFPKTTTQEWEMADDLGDNHPKSLQQGGQIPASSTAFRTAGKIYVEAGKPFTVFMHPADSTNDLTLVVSSTCNDSISGKGDLTKTITPTTSGWVTIKARNTIASNSGQKVWIKATYTAPQVLNTAVSADAYFCSTVTSVNTSFDSEEIYVFPNPSSGLINVNRNREGYVKMEVLDVLGKVVHSENMNFSSGETKSIDLSALPHGIYFLKIEHGTNKTMRKIALSRN